MLNNLKVKIIKMKIYQYIKIDHDSDCAAHNEPAMSKGNCNCGLIPEFYKGASQYVSLTKPHIHEGEADSIGAAFQAGYNFKSGISSDIEFLLDEFKSIEPENFDKLGNKYANTLISAHTAELMRHLIFKLEEHIKQVDNSDYAF